YPLRRRALQHPIVPTSPFSGAADIVPPRLLFPSGEGRGPPSPTRLSTGPDCPQSVPDRAAPPGRGSAHETALGGCGEAATHPTRPETRTKEENAAASERAPPCLGGIPAPRRGAHHRPVSPALSGRWSKSARDRTRKMVNYAWAGRSQRKLWWRPVAVLTCKSVVRPGYRGERLIEPSGSWFPPKFPSG